MKKLQLSFYKRKDVVAIAKELIGKIVVTKFDGFVTSGRIVETEAYVAHTDKASHSFGGRRTAKNEHMYAHAGTAYVYICYGMHQMFNVVTNEKDIPDAHSNIAFSLHYLFSDSCRSLAERVYRHLPFNSFGAVKSAQFSRPAPGERKLVVDIKEYVAAFDIDVLVVQHTFEMVVVVIAVEAG